VVRGPRPDEDTTAGSRSTPGNAVRTPAVRWRPSTARGKEATEIPTMGAFAYFKDTEGNVVGSWETF
jgi:hypothetical protein